MEKLDFARVVDFLYLSIQIITVLKNIDCEIINSLARILKGEKKKVVVTTHENPDGDAIGSAIGMGEVLKNYGHDVSIIVPNDYPPFLQWFSSKIEILIYEKQKKEAEVIFNSANLLVCLDFNDAKRVGKLGKIVLNFDKEKILIDHHPNPTDLCELMVSEPSYSSTAELVFDVVKQIELDNFIDSKAAEALFTGIMTDTGSFSHSIARSNVFKVVYQLIEKGINTEKIHAAVFHSFSESKMKLLGYCLDKKMEVFPQYRAAVIYLSQKELDRYNFQPGDTEGVVNYPLSIKNIVFSTLFIEKKGYVKASFRSKGSFPVNEFSGKYFSGGGHRNAAGGESKLSLNKTIEKYKQLLDVYKHQLIDTII